jgi:6-phosphogluconolactonase
VLRSIGSVAVLSLLMVGCGGGGGSGSASNPPPPPANYTVGGTVTGLTGSGLVLMFSDNALSGPHATSLAVPGSGGITFPPAVPQGSTYMVSVGTQPNSPAQNCVVTNGTGVVGAANFTNVTVACSNVAGYTVGGSVSGLVGSGLTLAICSLHSNGYGSRGGHYVCGSPLQVSTNGAFTMSGAYPALYSGPDLVLVTQQPSSPTQRCLVGNATINITNANDTSVTVSCADYNEYAYVTNAADNTLSSYRVDSSTGVLTVVGTPIATGESPYAIANLDLGIAGQRFVFIGNEGSNDVSAFVVNSATGALTAVPGSPFPAGKDPKAMAVSRSVSGSYNLFVANAGSDDVSVYTIDNSTGTLTELPGSPVPVGKNPTSVVVDPEIGAVFVANHGGSNDISAFYSFDLTPVPGSPFPAGGSPLSLDFGAGGKFLYAANPDTTNPSVSGFSIDPVTGALSPVRGSPFSLPVSHYMAIEQTGIQTGSNPISGYLYVTTDADIFGYAFDWSTGALTALPGFPVAAGANAYSVKIVGTQFLYVVNDGAANISGFALDLLTGALTPMAGSPFPAGNQPKFIATF